MPLNPLYLLSSVKKNIYVVIITYRCTATTCRAILLIDDDGVIDLIDSNVLNGKMWNSAWLGGSPCLDSHPICSTNEGAVSYVHEWHIVTSTLAKASNADSVARTAVNSADFYLVWYKTEGYAIVPGGDHWIQDFDVVWCTNVDSVGVRAVTGSWYGDVLNRYVMARKKVNVDVVAVDRCYVMDLWICDEIQSQGLT